MAYTLALLVHQDDRRYTQRRVKREEGETVEAYAERVKAQLVELLTKPNS